MSGRSIARAPTRVVQPRCILLCRSSTRNGLVTGLHSPGETHFELLRAFAPRGVLAASLRHAELAGYATHEFGDLGLTLSGR